MNAVEQILGKIGCCEHECEINSRIILNATSHPYQINELLSEIHQIEDGRDYLFIPVFYLTVDPPIRILSQGYMCRLHDNIQPTKLRQLIRIAERQSKIYGKCVRLASMLEELRKQHEALIQ